MTDSELDAAALERLPVARGLTFRGVPMDGKVPEGGAVTTVATVTTRDPRVATENFAHVYLLAIASRTGRAHGDIEVVLPAGVTLLPVAQIKVREADVTVRLVEEVDRTTTTPDNSGLPGSLSEFCDEVSRRVLEAFRRPALDVTSPGRYAGDLE
jgi:hypothetical protein